MIVTVRQLQRIIRENVLQESTLFVTYTDYGSMGIEDDQGNAYSLGTIIAELLDAGAADEIFTDHGRQGGSLERLQAKREEGIQGGIERWDSDVFDTYYNVDRARALQLWATLNGFTVEEVEEEDEYAGWDEYPEQVQASREAAWEESDY